MCSYTCSYVLFPCMGRDVSHRFNVDVILILRSTRCRVGVLNCASQTKQSISALWGMSKQSLPPAISVDSKKTASARDEPVFGNRIELESTTGSEPAAQGA